MTFLGAPFRAWWTTFSLAGAFLLGSCNLADGLTDVAGSLGDPDATLLDRPGRRLAEGSFHNLLIDGSLDDGGHVVALEERDDGRRMTIIPYLEGDPCSVSPALDFQRLSSRVDVELKGILSVQRKADDEGWGRIAFVDFDCKEVMPPLEKSRLPRQIFPVGEPIGVLNLDQEGTLAIIDPRKKEVRTIAKDVEELNLSQDHIFTLREGKLAVFGPDTKLVDEVGDHVVELHVTQGKTFPVAYRDDEGLFAWSEEFGSVLISDDPCHAGRQTRTPDAEEENCACASRAVAPDAIGYFSSCDGQEVEVFTSGELVHLDHPMVRLGGLAGVTDLGSLNLTSSLSSRPAEVLYLRGDTGSSSGALVLAVVRTEDAPPEDQEEVQEVSLEFQRLGQGVTLRFGQYFKDYLGETSSGTLVEVERDDEGQAVGLRRIAKNVAQLPGSAPFSPRGILTDLEGRMGTLRFLTREKDDSISSRVLGRNVPLQNQSVDGETLRTAFIADSEDGYLGTLYVTSGPTPRKETLTEISDRVLLDTARFMVDPDAIAYLYRGKDGSAALKAWLVEAELNLQIHPRVSEYRTVPWPAPGILYAVPDGEDQGLWYSKAR